MSSGMNEMSSAEFLRQRLDGAAAAPMFVVPKSYTGWRYVARQAATVAPLFAFLAATGPWLVSTGGVVAAIGFMGTGLVYTTFLGRMESIKQGKPLGGWLWGFPKKPMSYNSGRTLLPDYAQFQTDLDLARTGKPPVLSGRDRHLRGAPGGKGGQFR